MKDYPNVQAGKLKETLYREDLDRNDRSLNISVWITGGAWKLVMNGGRWKEWTEVLEKCEKQK